MEMGLIKWREVTESAYDGSKLPRYYCDWGLIWGNAMSPKNSTASLLDRNLSVIRFRLPRKLKKKVKNHVGVKSVLKRRTLSFYYDVFKTAKYYNCKIKQEGGE